MKVLRNFYWFLYRLIKHRNDDMFVSDDISKKRLDICNSCEFINQKGLLVKLKGDRCGICGCFTQYKTLFEFEECPKEKW